eukprot:139454-Rhodomonas_salina.2
MMLWSCAFHYVLSSTDIGCAATRLEQELALVREKVLSALCDFKHEKTAFSVQFVPGMPCFALDFAACRSTRCPVLTQRRSTSCARRPRGSGRLWSRARSRAPTDIAYAGHAPLLT